MSKHSASERYSDRSVGGAKTISLSAGKVALVDRRDFDWLNQWKWHYSGGYARRRASIYERSGGSGCWVMMHRALLDTPPDLRVDHVSGDGLDNRRANLRECTPGQNMWNQGPQKGRRLKGAFLTHGKWQASIKSNGVRRNLGTFATQEDAARAYDAAARELHGDFARTNYPEQVQA